MFVQRSLTDMRLERQDATGQSVPLDSALLPEGRPLPLSPRRDNSSAIDLNGGQRTNPWGGSINPFDTNQNDQSKIGGKLVPEKGTEPSVEREIPKTEFRIRPRDVLERRVYRGTI